MNRGVLSPQAIISQDVNTDGEFLMTVTVHYTLDNTEEYKDITINCGWPGTEMGGFHQAIREGIKANQPEGYDLDDSDIIFPLFQLGSMI